MDQDLIAYLDQRFSEIDQRFDKVDQRLERVETEVRHAHVAIEDLRDKVRLAADGIANNNEQLNRYRDEASLNVSNVQSFNRRCYEDLDVRVRKLEAAG